MDRATADELLKHAEWLRALARALVRDGAAADDALQQTWLSALRRPPRLGQPVRPWLATVLRNAVRSGARAERSRRHREERAAEPQAAFPSAEDLLAEHEGMRVLSEEVSALDEPYRTTVLLCYSKGLTPSQVAQREGIPAGTVRWRLKQGMDELRRRMDRRHGGNRRAWALLLAPGVSKGALLVKKKLSVAAVVALLLGLGGVGLWQSGWSRGDADRARTVGATSGKRIRPHGVAPSLAAPDPFDDAGLGTGVLDGVVRTPAGDAVEGATVVVARHRPTEVDRLGTAGARAEVTDARGHFRFTGLAPGRYTATAAADAGTARRAELQIAAGARLSVDLVLESGGVALRGRVLDVGGGGIAGATVWARALRDIGLADDSAEVYRTTSASDGTYELGLPAGRYLLVAESSGYLARMESLFAGKNQTKDLRLFPAGQVTGRVIDRASRAPVADAEVWLVKAEGARGSLKDVRTDGDGRFAFTDVDVGTYQAAARRGPLVGVGKPVTVGVAETSTDVEIALEAGLTIAGRVAATDGRAVVGARVQAVKDVWPHDRAASVAVDERGGYRMEGLLAGRYRLAAVAAGAVPVEKTVELTRSLDGVDLALSSGAKVRGTVVDARGAPVAAAQVSVRVTAPDDRPGGALLRTTLTNARGEFALDDLRGGLLAVLAEHTAHGTAHVGPEDLAVGADREIRLQLSPAASITGIVRFPDGSVVAGAQVVAEPAFSPAGLFIPARDVTGADGSYRLVQLPPGQTRVAAARGREPDGLSTIGGGHARTITLAAAEQRAGVDLVLERGDQSISGVIHDPDGHPIEGAIVAALVRAPGGSIRRIGDTVLSDRDGAFLVEGLAARSHAVYARHASFADGGVERVMPGGGPITIRLNAASTLAGAVRDDGGRAVTDYTIALTRPGDRGPSPSQRVRDDGGAFAFARIAGGTYDVRAETHDGRVGRAAITVEPGQSRRDVQLIVGEGVAVSGRVVEYHSGAPMSDIEVQAEMTGAANRTTRTDGHGAFTVRGVVPGRVRLKVVTNPRTHVWDTRVVDVPADRRELDLGRIRILRGDSDAKYAALERSGRGSLGIDYENRNGRLTILGVRPGEVGEEAGVQIGDLLVSIDGQDVRDLGARSAGFLIIRLANAPITLELETPGRGPRTVTTKLRLRN